MLSKSSLYTKISDRISFDKRHDKIEKGDDSLIDFLLRNRHGTPFEFIEFAWQIRAPITVVREWQRHRIASYNEMSGRYVKMEPDMYLPAPDAIRIQRGKPGHYVFEPIQNTNIETLTINVMESAYRNAYSAYEQLLEFGLAKELARNVLPLGLFTEFRFKVNARSLMNFLSLRNADNAMLEIKKYAQALEEDFKRVAPLTFKAFKKHGRRAP